MVIVSISYSCNDVVCLYNSYGLNLIDSYCIHRQVNLSQGCGIKGKAPLSSFIPKISMTCNQSSVALPAVMKKYSQIANGPMQPAWFCIITLGNGRSWGWDDLVGCVFVWGSSYLKATLQSHFLLLCQSRL